LVVDKAVHDTVRCVELMRDDVEILSISDLIPAKDGIRDVVCQLDDSGCPGIQE
jgi:hypothetical protein